MGEGERIVSPDEVIMRLGKSLFLLSFLLLSGSVVAVGCEMLSSKPAAQNLERCETAVRCCEELNQASAYNEVLGRVEDGRKWPNHCPSWKARSVQECSSFLDAVKDQKTTLEKDHPVYDHEFCE
jgi:hypothetical protein